MGLFSRYAHPFEKTVNSFIKHVSESSSRQHVQNQLITFLQTNTVVLNLWMEKRFKNYRYLTTKKRKQLYANTDALLADFNRFVSDYAVNTVYVESVFQQYRLAYPYAYTEQLHYLHAIMVYLQPGRRYNYIETATFGKLLQDPTKAILEGDCNQIVTLYLYLYAQRFPVTDLQVKVLQDHVCLHFQGIDVEATTGSYTHYREYEYVAPVSELVSINMLDVSDFRERTGKMSANTLLKSAQVAYVLSSMQQLVDRNLRVAYYNLALFAIKRKNYKAAMRYAQKADYSDLLRYVREQVVAQAVKSKNFSKAMHYAKQSGNNHLVEYVESHHAHHLYHKGSYAKARQKFQKLRNTKMVRVTYAGEYNTLLKKVAGVKTLSGMKQQRSTYKKLLTLAKRGKMKEAERSIQKILRQI